MSQEFSFNLSFDDFDRSLIGNPPIGSDEFRRGVSQFFADQYQGIGGNARVIIDDQARTIEVHWTKSSTGMDPKQKAIELLNEGNRQQALPILTALLYQKPNDPEVLHAIGLIHIDLGDFAKAAHLLEQALEIDHKFLSAYVALGVAEICAGNLLIGEEHLRRALKIDPEDHYALKNLSATLMKQQRFAEALMQIKRTLAVAPDDISMMIEMGDCLNHLGRSGESEQYYRRAIKTGGPERLLDIAKARLTAKSESVLKANDEVRQDVVEFMRKALKRFKGMSTEDIQCIALEIAVLGTKGLGINDSKKTYIIDSLPGEFTALELVSIMYAAFQQFAPESDIGIDLSVEYRVATRD
jgi:tetratricopeptide (TPR) repeat protein